MKLGRFFALAAFAASLLVAGESRAGLITLPSPLDVLATPGNFFQVDDKTFTILDAVPAGSQPRPLSSTVISSIPSVPFGFNITGTPVLATAPDASSVLSLIFTVTSSGPPITGVNLSGTGVTSSGTTISIAETVHAGASPTGTEVGKGQIIGSGDVFIPLSGAFSTVTIDEGILATAGTSTPIVASDLSISQTFVQGVPEPASMAILGTGLVGVIGFTALRRRKAANARVAPLTVTRRCPTAHVTISATHLNSYTQRGKRISAACLPFSA